MKCDLENMKIAGDIHKKIKVYIKENIKIDMKLFDLANQIEDQIKILSNYDSNNPLYSGIAFPTGLSINNCAAHWTPQKDNIKKLKEMDVIKIDFGVHIDGSIIDSAFTHSFHSKYDKLLEASKTSTDLAIKLSRPDMLLSEIGREIEENMKSYEINLNGKVKKIVPVNNLCGHEINKYQIHGNKVIPNIYLPKYNERIKEDEFYAVETFATTGKGETYEDKKNCSHYMINYKEFDITNTVYEEDFYNKIVQYYNTLAFTDRWIIGNSNETKQCLKILCDKKIVVEYPPIYDIDKKSYISQFEETIYIDETQTYILSN